MSLREKREVLHNVSSQRIHINLILLPISFTVFTFIIAVKPDLFSRNILVPLQLILSIPLIISSTFARCKQMYAFKNLEMWNNFGYITFIISYGFLINVIGILVSTLISVPVAMIFFIANILLAITYSIVDISKNKDKIRIRVYKNIAFSAILLFLGILPSLGVY